MDNGTVRILRGFAAFVEAADGDRVSADIVPERARTALIDAMVYVFGPEVMSPAARIPDYELPLFLGLAAEVLESEES